MTNDRKYSVKHCNLKTNKKLPNEYQNTNKNADGQYLCTKTNI